MRTLLSKEYDVNHSLDSLVVHLSRLNVGRNRVCKVAEFRNICCRCDVNAFRVVVEGRISGSHGWRKAIVHSRVDEFRALCKEKLADMMKGKTGFLHRVGDGHSLEIAAMVNCAGLAINEGIIRCCSKY